MCARYEISRVRKLIFNPRTEKNRGQPLPEKRDVQDYTVSKIHV